MDSVTNFINEYQDIFAVILSFLLVHFGASIATVVTKTKNTKLYKLLEVLALVFGKAKQKAEEDKKDDGKTA